MTTAVEQLLNSFDALSDAEKHEATREILRRVPESSDDVSEDDQAAAADDLFGNLDRGEAADGLEADGPATAVSDATQISPVRLARTDGNLLVAPDDEDRFADFARDAARVRRRGPRDAPIRMFKRDFLLPLMDWCAAHADRVLACYVARPREHVLGFVIGRSVRHDFDLGEKIAEMEMQLFDAGWAVELRQPPRPSTVDDIRIYFNPEDAVEVYGQLETAPGQGEP
jgi:hypothetical protein